ncbi:hypothetical protein [Rhodococcus sp. NBC_00294]|uniref:hypothetical protein n=1 Tax=Rhodococcus sp. NBC_00294 TaxID=2976004 RepID=UPI002E293F49|nr:hypothetical protein [Rhodococcus sp. NBC_00294]
MDHDSRGLGGIPAGNPGFTVAVEIDRPFDQIEPDEYLRLLHQVGDDAARIDRSLLGHARVVLDVPGSGWWVSGQAALHAVDRLAEEWTVLGVETSRSDLWSTSPHMAGSRLPRTRRLPASEGTRYTVIIEIEPYDELVDDVELSDYFRSRERADVVVADNGRRHIIVSRRDWDVSWACQLTAKSLHVISNAWSITRIRTVETAVWKREHSRPRVDNRPTAIPQWQYALRIDGTRCVVVTDKDVDLVNWYAKYTNSDGMSGVEQFFHGPAWLTDDGVANLRRNGDAIDAWIAPLPRGGLLDNITDGYGRVLPVDDSEGTAAWLMESMFDKPAGLIIELGPSDYDPDDEGDVFNAQIHVLDDGVYMVRRSRAVLQRLRLVDHGVEGLELDHWHHDDHFDDCTDGYLFSRDTQLIANACVAWFRQNGVTDERSALGCSYEFVDELPRTS